MNGSQFTISKSTDKGFIETLKVDLKKGEVKAHIHILRFQDIDTKQFVMYVPSLEISGYGETSKLAEQMTFDSLQEYFASLIELNIEQLHIELRKCGWGKTHFQKQFSKLHVNSNGDLQGFNADPNTIEKLTLVA